MSVTMAGAVPASPTTTNPANDGAKAAAGASSSRGMIDSDFETFLRMLTVQMQNQDPLNPIESSDFATQLATFAGVEQQTRTNQLIEAIADRLGAGVLQETAGWVGMEALVEMPVSFAGAPLELGLSPLPEAESAELVVRDATGREVGRHAIDPRTDRLIWDGTTDLGKIAVGTGYGLTVESLSQGAVIDTRPAAVFAMVREAQVGADGSARLLLDGGREIAANDVRALRKPAQ